MDAGFSGNPKLGPRRPMEQQIMAKNTSTTRKGSPTPAPAVRKAPPKPLVNPIRTVGGSNGKTEAGPRIRNISLDPVVFSHDQIAHRAYQLWQQTGNPDELSNWAEAERQLKAELRGI